MIRIKKIVVIISVAVFIFSVFSGEAVAQEKKGFLVKLWERFRTRPEEKPKEPVKPKPSAFSSAQPEQEEAEPVKSEKPVLPQAKFPVSKQRMIAAIDKATKAYPEIFDIIPELVLKGTIRGGEELYYGPKDGVKLKISSMDSEDLFDLFKKVNEAAITAAQKRRAEPVVEPGEGPKAPQKEKVEQAEPSPVVFDSKRLDDEEEFYEDIELEEDLPEEGPEIKGEASTRPEIPISIEDMLKVINKRLEIYSEIVFMIPDLVVRENEDGNKRYYFAPEGQIAQKIEDLDKETLHKLFVRINNEATRINTQRLMRQLQQQEMVMRQMQGAIQQPPQPPPQPPRVYSPPVQQPPPQPPPQPPQPAQPPRPPQVTGPPRNQ